MLNTIKLTRKLQKSNKNWMYKPTVTSQKLKKVQIPKKNWRRTGIFEDIVWRNNILSTGVGFDSRIRSTDKLFFCPLFCPLLKIHQEVDENTWQSVLDVDLLSSNPLWVAWLSETTARSYSVHFGLTSTNGRNHRRLCPWAGTSHWPWSQGRTCCKWAVSRGSTARQSSPPIGWLKMVITY